MSIDTWAGKDASSKVNMGKLVIQV